MNVYPVIEFLLGTSLFAGLISSELSIAVKWSLGSAVLLPVFVYQAHEAGNEYRWMRFYQVLVDALAAVERAANRDESYRPGTVGRVFEEHSIGVQFEAPAFAGSIIVNLLAKYALWIAVGWGVAYFGPTLLKVGGHAV